MRVFGIRSFSKWASKNGLTTTAILSAVAEVKNGLVDANYGGNLYKKRIATKGRGKRGSVRTLLVYSDCSNFFFLFAFEKSERENISDNEAKALKLLGADYLKFTDKQIETDLASGELVEYKEDENGR